MKACIKCGDVKPLGEFYRRPDSPDGYRNDCKTCRKLASSITYASDVEKQKAYRRDRYKKLVSENPSFHRDKYWADPTKARNENKNNYRKNRATRIKKAVEYASRNKAKVNSIKARYKLAKKQACPSWVLESKTFCDRIDRIYERARRLTEETGVMHHVDHIVPTQGKTICGLHVPWNLQVLTASENCSKQNKFLEVTDD